ncbi:hypothetical protein MASR2M18_04960 [Ignavibacteria bacterium]|nr:hypothetical protein [Bacteroidota bacterium]MCZ2131943.1 hypothetical protein [Bacteroidota bacterium]
MKLSRILFTLCALILAAWSGCDDNSPPPVRQQTPPTARKELSEQVQTQQPQLDKVPIAAPFETPKGQLASGELRNFLPASIAGSPLESPSAGRIRRSETTAWTRASGQYGTSGGNVSISITDYGEAVTDEIKKRYQPPFKEVGLIVEKLTTPGGDGFRLYNEHDKSGSAAILVNGRIGIEINVTNYPSRDFDKIINAIDAAGLSKAASKK